MGFSVVAVRRYRRRKDQGLTSGFHGGSLEMDFDLPVVLGGTGAPYLRLLATGSNGSSAPRKINQLLVDSPKMKTRFLQFRITDAPRREGTRRGATTGGALTVLRRIVACPP